jgi:ribosomal protein L37AE/L43A
MTEFVIRPFDGHLELVPVCKKCGSPKMHRRATGAEYCENGHWVVTANYGYNTDQN